MGAATRLVALLGSPVAHSASPAIHDAAFAAAGVDARYLAFDVPPPALAAAVAGLGALGALGANVTVPHKQAALALASTATPEARLVGAANTLWWVGGELHADNTDAAGLEQVLRRDVALRPGDPVVLLGAGGAARAAAVALGRCGAEVVVAARRGEAAADVAALVDRAGGTGRPGAWDCAPPSAPRLLVNATSVGLHGEVLADPWASPPAGTAVLDLVYGPAATPLVADARRRQAPAWDGLGMLVAQAALAFERWTGLPAPLAAMDGAARAALGR